MDWMTEQIAVGDVDDALDIQQQRANSVTAMLSLYGFPTPILDEPVLHQQVLLADGPGTSVELLHRALTTLKTMSTSHKVLVHCMEGLSRSPFVVACHLALERKIGLPAALELIQEKRHISIHPYFYSLWSEYLAWREQRDTFDETSQIEVGYK